MIGIFFLKRFILQMFFSFCHLLFIFVKLLKYDLKILINFYLIISSYGIMFEKSFLSSSLYKY